MASITQSVAGLVSFGATVTGVTASYDLKTLFDNINAITCPVLLAVPQLGDQSGFQTQAFMGQAPRIDFMLEHYLLFAPIAASADITLIMPAFTALIDAYFVALKALPFFTATSAPSSHTAPKTTYNMARSKWGEVDYHACVFKHQVGLNL